MDFNKAINLKLNCSEFMKFSEYCNDDTLFLVFDTLYRTHKLYLILNFIYKKYKNLICQDVYLEKIERYIKTFENESGINSRKFTSGLIAFCNELEECFFNESNIERCYDIDEYLTNNTSANIIIIDKESYFKNEYVCYIKE